MSQLDPHAAEHARLTELLRLDSSDLELQHQRAIVRAELGDIDGAIEDLSRIISADPEITCVGQPSLGIPSIWQLFSRNLGLH